MKKRIVFSIVFLFACLAMNINAQMFDPIDIQTKSIQTGENTYKILIQAEIESGWSTYSQISEDEFGPFPTSITFEDENVEVVGEYAEECGNIEKKYDKVFEMELTKFHEHAVFIQTIKVNEETSINGFITFQACDNEKCLPPTDYEFSIDLASSEKVDNFVQDVYCEKDAWSAASTSKASTGFEDPLEWSFEIKKKDNSEYDLLAKAKIKDGWKVYGPHDKGFDGPFITTMYFDSLQGAEKIGEVEIEAAKQETAFDEQFEMTLTSIKKEVQLLQKVKSKTAKERIIGFVEYQTCDSTQCLPPTTVPFVFDIKELKAFNPEEGNVLNLDTKGEGTPVEANFDYSQEQNTCDGAVPEKDNESQSFWWIFLAGFAGGFLALLTPCVFPMIPLTVSFFTKSSKDRASGIRNAFIYGFSIIIIYVLLGLLVTGIFGADALNLLSTNAWFNIFFFVLFVVFALSFFGFFEITLPSSWTNKTDRAADRGGLIGIFFMAFTLSLVSFSCTGPIIGTLLVETATGGGPTILGNIPIGPLVGMFGFALALALPFALFAAFPSWLNSLPKSGSWMNGVKVFLGFVELALALKFLSVADLTMGWKILPYELFIVLWIICAIGIALYFFGWLKLPLDYKKPNWNTKRAIVGFVAILLAAYIGTGFTYSYRNKTFVTPSLLSGLAPPAGHSYIYPNKCPLNIDCFKDYYKAKAYAEQVGKPLLIDFTGHGCVNCRKMEDNVWSEESIYNMIKDDFVLVSLYVDERTSLDVPYISALDQKEKRTVGNRWADFQAIHFKRNSQPYYVLSSPEGKILNKPVGYTPNKTDFKSFLDCGLSTFKN